MGDNELIGTIEPKTFHFDLPADAGINLNHEIMKFILLIPNGSDSVPDIQAYIEYTIKNMKNYHHQSSYSYSHQ